MLVDFFLFHEYPMPASSSYPANLFQKRLPTGEINPTVCPQNHCFIKHQTRNRKCKSAPCKAQIPAQDEHQGGRADEHCNQPAPAWGAAEATCTNPIYSAKNLPCSRKQRRAEREVLVIKNEQQFMLC